MTWKPATDAVHTHRSHNRTQHRMSASVQSASTTTATSATITITITTATTKSNSNSNSNSKNSNSKNSNNSNSNSNSKRACGGGGGEQVRTLQPERAGDEDGFLGARVEEDAVGEGRRVGDLDVRRVQPAVRYTRACACACAGAWEGVRVVPVEGRGHRRQHNRVSVGHECMRRES
jgi:hypothetical protein